LNIAELSWTKLLYNWQWVSQSVSRSDRPSCVEHRSLYAL